MRKRAALVMKFQAQIALKKPRALVDAENNEEPSRTTVEALAPHPRATSSKHPESVDEIQLYQTAKRWANSRGCFDERRYPDFLAAEMSPSELTSLIRRTRKRHETIVNGSSSLSKEDPLYTGLLQDMQVAYAVSDRRTETRNILARVGQCAGYLGFICFVGATEPLKPATSLVSIGLDLITLAVLARMSGSLIGDVCIIAEGDFITRQRSKWLVKNISKQEKAEGDPI